jgi:hypothetical protein
LAAPVLVGMMFTAADRARCRVLCGESSSAWSLVYALTAVRYPCSMPNALCSTEVIGATVFLAHDAADRISCHAGS